MTLRQATCSSMMLACLALASCEQSLTDVAGPQPKSAPHHILLTPEDSSTEGIPPDGAWTAEIINFATYATLKGMSSQPGVVFGVLGWVFYRGNQASNNISFTASGDVSASNSTYAEGLGTAGPELGTYKFETWLPLNYLPSCGETLSANTVHGAWYQVRYPFTITWGRAAETSMGGPVKNVDCATPTAPADGGPTTDPEPTDPSYPVWPAPPQDPIDQPPTSGIPLWCETVYLYDGAGNVYVSEECYAI